MMELGISYSHGHVSELENCEVPSIIKQEPELGSNIKIENLDIQELKYELTDQEMKIEIGNLVVDQFPKDVPQEYIADNIYSSEDCSDNKKFYHLQIKCSKSEFDEAIEIKNDAMVEYNGDSKKQVQSSNLISHNEKPIRKTLTCNKHEKKRLNSREKIYKCQYCNYQSSQKASVKSHTNCKHTRSEIHTCQYCDYKSPFMSALKTHINSIHTREKIHNCQYCDYVSPVKSSLKSHIDRKHIKNIYKCEYCDYGSRQMKDLKFHIKSIHRKEEINKCQYCDYESPDTSAIKRHINAMHTREKIYKCQYCDFGSPYKSSIIKHVNSKHTREKIYKCQHCDYGSPHISTIEYHINAKHNRKDKQV